MSPAGRLVVHGSAGPLGQSQLAALDQLFQGQRDLGVDLVVRQVQTTRVTPGGGVTMTVMLPVLRLYRLPGSAASTVAMTLVRALTRWRRIAGPPSWRR